MKKYLIFLIALASIVNRASAYTYIVSSNGSLPAWPSMPVPFWINQSGSPQIANGSEFQAVTAAFQTWQNVSIANISFQNMGTTPASTVGQDGLNLVTFVDNSTPLGSATIAATFSFFSVDGTGNLAIQEADIALNRSFAFSTSGDPGKYDIQAVVTHEIGHFLGLDHSALLSSVMTPYGAAGQLDQRTLSYDDIAGVATIYPQSSDVSALAGIAGTITLAGNPIFGAQVVALDANGSVTASAISNPDGTYEIDFIPPGAYRLYAEALDGPITQKNIGGTANSYYTGLNTSFSTTYSGDVANFGSATAIQTFAGRVAQTGDIHVFPVGNLNLTVPINYAAHIGLGSQGNLTVGGSNIVSGDSFSTTGAGITLGSPAYGGALGSTAPTSAQLPVSVAANASTGPKDLAVTANGITSVLSGGIVIVNPQPTGISVAPVSGTMDGGMGVSITGQNFRAGAAVYFAGLPASNVQVVNSTTIQAITPANASGPANIVVVNNDGTWGVQLNGFSYAALPPQITNIAPLGGPPGTLVTIVGAEFSSRISDMNVRINGAPANVVSTSRTSVTAVVPYGATTGPITVTVGGQTANGPSFTVTSAPSTNFALTTGKFIDVAAGGTPLAFGNNDDASAVTTLPFPFTLFDKTYAAGSPIAISTNGWMSLDTFTDPEFQNGPLPGTQTPAVNGRIGSIPPALVAPFYTDLLLPASSGVAFQTVGTAPNRRFVTEWFNASILDQQGNDLGASATFEAILYEGSNDIQFIYGPMNGPKSDGSSATIGIQNSARTQAVQTGYNQAVVANGAVIGYHFTNGAYGPLATTTQPTDTAYSIVNSGGLSLISDGSGSTTATGFGLIQPNSGSTTPSGVAIFGYKPSGVLVSEAGVPASVPLTSGRIYAEIGGSVNTGLAIANPNNATANISFSFTDASGTDSNSGTITVPANGHIAKFLSDPAFNAVANFQGAFSFTSDAPVAVIALRGFTNERGEFLMSTLPVTDLSAAVANSTTVLPHFADGGGWKTQIILVNPTDSTITGQIHFLTPAGQTISTFPYSISRRGSFKQVTPGTSTSIQTGSVQVIPDAGMVTPTSVAIFSNRPNGITVSEAAVLPTTGTALRMYVEGSGVSGAVGNIASGVALANTGTSPITVNFTLTDLAGNLLGSATQNVPASGQVAEFANDIFSSVTLPFQGVLRVSVSGGSVAVAALRGRYNERNDFLMSTTPATNENAPPANTTMVFPHIVNGGGFTTQFILFSGAANQSANGNLHLSYAN